MIRNRMIEMMLALLMSLFVLTGCGNGTDAGSGDADNPDDTAYNMAEIVLEENPSTGYCWTVAQAAADGEAELLTIADEYKDTTSSEDQADAEKQDDQQDVSSAELGMVGAAGTHAYFLTVSQAGQAAAAESDEGAVTVTLTFTYARSWEETALYTVEYDFTIDAEGNLKFLEKRADASDESAAESMPEFPDPVMGTAEK